MMETKQRPLLSIIIPTRNRTKYIKSAIISILAIKDTRIELVIQDNSDDKELGHWIDEMVKDFRMNYNYSEEPLSFVGNFSKGVEIACGEYLCIIGDDDGINPEIINAAEWLKNEEIDCLSTTISANYVWGDAEVPKSMFTKVTDGVLSISQIQDYIIQSNVQQELKSFLEGGAVNYLDFKLPKIYHGIVSANCLELVKEKTGVYFGGLSPDIFASISIATIAKKVYVTDYPLTISGVCGVSASIVEGLLKKNSKKLEDAPHLRNRGYYEWSEFIPKVYCVETIWADSAISALDSMGESELAKLFNLPKFSANCALANRDIKEEVIHSFNQNFKKLGFSNLSFYYYYNILKLKYFPRLIKRIFNRIMILGGRKNFYKIDDINDINEATLALTGYLSKKNISFQKHQIKR